PSVTVTRQSSSATSATLSTCAAAGDLSLDDLDARLVRRVVAAQHVSRPLARLPRRHRRLALLARHEARAVDQTVLVDVARAVREDLRRPDANDELRLRVLGEQRVVVRDGCCAV